MTQNQIASLSLKLLGIYSIIQSIPLLKGISAVFAWRGSNMEMIAGGLRPDVLLFGILVSIGLLFLGGLCLIIFSDAFAKKMVQTKELSDSTTELSARNIQAIAFSVVGLVMVVIAIPHLVQLAANLSAMKLAGS